MNKQKLFPVVCIVMGLGVFAWYNNLPKGSIASTDAMSSYVLYGIGSVTGELERFTFASGELDTIGTIQDSAGTTLTGIQASAYIPGFANIYGFWQDPSDGLSKLVYINAKTANATVVGQDLGEDPVTGATAVVDGARYRVFALQTPDLVEFDVSGGTVVPTEEYATRFTVLGAAISDGYDQPVGVRLNVGGSTYEPFGVFSSALDSNVNDELNPRSFVLPTMNAALDTISIVGQSWLMVSGEDGDIDSEWYIQRTVDSQSGSAQVKVLRDGDDVPSIPGFADQASIVDFVEDYVDLQTGKMVLGENQAIYLFELGTTDLASAAADFQDLVVLVTLAKDPAVLADASISGALLSGKINLNPNNSPEYEFKLVKHDSTEITRDDLKTTSTVDTEGVFYEGPAMSIRVKAKGSGEQNSLLVDELPYVMDYDTVYTVSGVGLTAKVYNDQISSGGKAMGQWWVEVSTVDVTGDVTEGDYTPPVGRLVEVNHQTGVMTHVMDLGIAYDSLASGDGVKFYAFMGSDLYEIDTVARTQTLVGVVAGGEVFALEYAGADMYGFDMVTDKLAPVDPLGTPVVGTAVSLGTMVDLGTVIIVPLGYDPALYREQYD